MGEWKAGAVILPAVTILGFTFSGRELLIVVVGVAIVVAAAWYLLMRGRRS
jgi:hypothetical protein